MTPRMPSSSTPELLALTPKALVPLEPAASAAGAAGLAIVCGGVLLNTAGAPPMMRFAKRASAAARTGTLLSPGTLRPLRPCGVPGWCSLLAALAGAAGAAALELAALA